MQADDPRYLKRKIRSGSIDVHPTEKALVVNYELEALILGEMGDPMLGDKKEYQKIIRLNSLNSKTDCAALAKEVVDKCSLIHCSKLNEVEHLIHYLKSRKDLPPNNDGAFQQTSLPKEFSEKPSINNIDKYIEYLYEDIYEKVIGSSMILSLVKNPNNLEEMAVNEAALSALSRVLREDWKKNLDLTINIVHIFLCFSKYSQFHHIIIQYKIGSLCMEIIDYEIKKCENSEDKMNVSLESSESLNLPSKDVRKRQSMIPVGKKRSESANRLSASKDEYRKSLPASLIASKTMGDSFIECGKLESNNSKEILINKQNQLLDICIQLLLNIAENTKVEEKMRKKNISGMITKMLDRNSMSLLITCMKFLKKLSIFKENKDDMIESNTIEKLSKIFSLNNMELNLLTLKLMFNLSFDSKMREKIIINGFLPKIIYFLREESCQEVVLGLLYHLSMDDKVKSMFAYTDCIPVLMKMLLDKFEKLVVALCINLAVNKKNAEIMIEENRLQKFLERAFKYQDSLLMKVIHNIAMHESLKHGIVEFVGDIAKAVTRCDSEEFVMECVGILGCLTMPELDFNQVFQQFHLVPWIKNILIPGKAEDDMVLEVVILVGTAACDEDCAMLMCKADIPVALIELLKAKQEDDEIVLQIVYVFYQIIRRGVTREYLIAETDAAAYLIDLMQDKNKEIANLCDACLDIIGEYNHEWKKRIMVDKFRFHNSQWLEMVESQALDDAGYGFGEDDLPPCFSSDLMQHTMLYPSEAHVSLEDMAGEESILEFSEADGTFSRFKPEEEELDCKELGICVSPAN